MASRACLHWPHAIACIAKDDFAVNWVKGPSLTDDVTDDSWERFFEGSMDECWNDTLLSWIKPRSLVVADKSNVCGTCNRKQLNLLYCEEECLSTNSAFLIGPAVFCCRRLKSTEVRSIEDEDLSSRCMCPSNFNRFWDTARYLWKNRHFIIPFLHSTPPLGGFPSEYRHLLWDGKTRMVSLPDSEKISKICLFVLTWSTNVTDGQTDRHCMTAKTALA